MPVDVIPTDEELNVVPGHSDESLGPRAVSCEKGKIHVHGGEGRKAILSAFGLYLGVVKCILGMGMLSIPRVMLTSGLSVVIPTALILALFCAIGFIYWALAAYVTGSDNMKDSYIRALGPKYAPEVTRQVTQMFSRRVLRSEKDIEVVDDAEELAYIESGSVVESEAGVETPVEDSDMSAPESEELPKAAPTRGNMARRGSLVRAVDTLKNLSIGRFLLQQMLSIIMFAKCLFSLVAFSTTFADLLVTLFGQQETHPDSIWANRWFVLALFMVIILYPLTMIGGLHDLSRMKYLWLVSLLGIVFVFIVMLVDSIMVATYNDLPYLNTTYYHNVTVPGTNPPQYEVVKETFGYGVFWDIVSTICVFGSAYVCHYIAPKMFTEFTTVEPGQARPSKSQFMQYCWIVLASFLTCGFVFIAFGIVGMSRFGDETLGNVLKSYGDTTGTRMELQGGVPSWLISVCWVFVIVSISTTWVFAYNIMFDSLRDLIHSTIARCKEAKGITNQTVSKFFNAVSAKKGSFIDGKIFNFVMTAFFIGITYITGSTIDSLATINFIKGATLTQLITFILPAGMVLGALRHFDAEMFSRNIKMLQVLVAWFLILFALFVMCSGLASFGLGYNVS